MHLDHDQLNQLLDKLAESDIQEFRLEGDDFRLEVRRNLPVMATATQMVPVAAAPTPAVEIKTQSESSSSAPPAAAGTRSDLVDVTAPMVGTFYRAPAPGEPAFVEIGNSISAGQTICILEAMKLMNELEAELSGEVEEILVDNGTPVEFGQVLMRVKPA